MAAGWATQPSALSPHAAGGPLPPPLLSPPATSYPGQDNLTYIRGLLQSLSTEQLQQLKDELGLSDQQEVLQWLGSKADTMHVRSYEQALMQYPEYKLNKILLLYLPPILIIMGTFGNIFSFIILKRKAMLKFSTYFYLMVLAIADTLVLYIGLLRLWIGELTGYDLRDQANWICKLTNVIGYTVSDFSVWLIIAVTIERYIVVCHPLKANAMCNTRRAQKVILGLLAGLALLNLHFFWTVQIVYFTHNGEEIPRCGAGQSHVLLVEEIWPWVDVFVYSFLPFVAILILNGLIIRQVVISRRHRQQLRINGSVYQQRRPSHEGSTRLTVMLLTISFAFLLTTLPMTAVNISATFLNQYRTDLHQVSKFTLARTITALLMYVNHSMNFFLYCATGQKFRHQLVWMICYAKRSTTFSWGSEPSQATKFETSVRNGLKRRSEGTEMCNVSVRRQSEYNATMKNDMYTPLKYSL